MDEELIRRLEEVAKLRGVTRSALIKEILEEVLDRSANPLKEAVLALRQGKKPGKKIDWSRIKKELQQTKPYFSTLEEAMAYSRKRVRCE
jgi:predicted DNA-binding protein